MNETSSCSRISDVCDTNCGGNNGTSIILTSNYSSYGPTYNTTKNTIAVQIAVTGHLIFGFLGSLFSSDSLQDIWSTINVIHLVLLLPLISRSMHGKVKNFIISNAFPTLYYYFLPATVIQSLPLIKDLTFDQPDDYLRKLGWQSGSTLVNNIVLVMILILLCLVHLLICLLQCVKNKSTKCNARVLKLNRFFTFTPYIRIFIQLYLFTTLMLASEIKYYIENGAEDPTSSENKQVRGNHTSLSISCVLFMLQLLFLFVAYISWIRNKDSPKIRDNCKTREFYNGICKPPKN